MSKIDMLFNYFLGPVAVIAILVACLIGLHLLLGRIRKDHPERALRHQVMMSAATLIAIFLTVVFLPVSESLRGQILSLLGILLSATIALSSTTFLGNALAGILLRSVKSFRSGDFIYINDQFGRVSGRGLFHIEIQTEDRDLVTLPNLYVTTNPVKVIRASGTIISAEVSIGYDIPHRQVDTLLQHAATAAGLQEPFVYIMRLQDFSILYRVNGMLAEVKQLLSARSHLNAAILDSLHGAGVEIVSPNFMNTRDVGGQKFAAQPVTQEIPADKVREPEEIIFDKAEKAATLEEQKASVEEIGEHIETLKDAMTKADDDKKKTILRVIERLEEKQKLLGEKISTAEKTIEQEENS